MYGKDEKCLSVIDKITDPLLTCVEDVLESGVTSEDMMNLVLSPLLSATQKDVQEEKKEEQEEKKEHRLQNLFDAYGKPSLSKKNGMVYEEYFTYEKRSERVAFGFRKYPSARIMDVFMSKNGDVYDVLVDGSGKFRSSWLSESAAKEYISKLKEIIMS